MRQTASLAIPMGSLLAADRRIPAFLEGLGLTEIPPDCTADAWLGGLSDTALEEAGLDRSQIADHLLLLMQPGGAVSALRREPIQTLTILGGQGKTGVAEEGDVLVRAGEIMCVVGPTGSGKSRLLADIECLAQGDTPSGRRILLNGEPPSTEERFAPDFKVVAQISQNMNFVVDLSVAEFLTMHAVCRHVDPESGVVERVIAGANALTGETFGDDVSVTQLSGGQARALMIADAALLSASPVLLIDEIENAGINRRQALDLLVSGDKIVLIATHDPLLALVGDRRIALHNGRIAAPIVTSAAERRNLRELERLDHALLTARERLRRGARLDEPIDFVSSAAAMTDHGSTRSLS